MGVLDQHRGIIFTCMSRMRAALLASPRGGRLVGHRRRPRGGPQDAAATAARRCSCPGRRCGGSPSTTSPGSRRCSPRSRRCPSRRPCGCTSTCTKPAGYYATPVARIAGVGQVMGELLDSSDEQAISTAAMRQRAESYVQALGGDVAIWEVGNEVNGNWTGDPATVAEKLDAAYEVVSAAGGRTALTLYENDFGPEHCGDGEAEPTPLQYARRYVPPRRGRRARLRAAVLLPDPVRRRRAERGDRGGGTAGTPRGVPQRAARLRRGGPAAAGQQAHALAGAPDHALGLLAGPPAALLRRRLLLVVRGPGRAAQAGAAARSPRRSPSKKSRRPCSRRRRRPARGRRCRPRRRASRRPRVRR